MGSHQYFTPFVMALGAHLPPGCTGDDVTTVPINAEKVLARASDAMGAATVSTLSYTGDGSGYTFGQAYTPDSPWPKVTLHSLTRSFNYESGSLREEIELSRAEPLGGGAYPLSGKQKNDQFVSGEFSWNMNGTNVVPFSFFRAARQHQLWASPHGIIKAAQASAAVAHLEIQAGVAKKTVSFTKAGTLRAKLYFDDAYHVEKIEAHVPDNLLGETTVVTDYAEYQDFAGVTFPAHVTQTQDGHPLADFTVRTVTANPAVDISVPDAVLNFSERVVSTLVAPGLWFVTGGSHNSVVIELAEYAILVEAPLTDDRGLAVVNEAKRLVPSKPIKYVINSHNHFDHAGGLRAAVASGLTVITQKGNQAYYEEAFATPNTIRPDALARSGLSATVEGVEEKLVLSDGARDVELHHIVGSNHCDTMLMIYLPNEKVLIEADLFTPGSNPNAPTPAVIDPQKVVLVDNIERLQLTIEQILPLHGRIATMKELLTAVGKAPAP
ncbi:MAG: MBL fold metallo-hydrolase [Myxococcota bacterium]